MGSRAVVLVCRDESVAAARFGIADGRPEPSRPGPAGRSSTASRRPPPCSPGYARRRPTPGCSTSWTPTGCCSTPSCCRGRPRPVGLIREQYAGCRRGRPRRAAGRPGGARRVRRAAASTWRALRDRLRPADAPTGHDGRPALLRRRHRRATCRPTGRRLDGLTLAPFAVLAGDGVSARRTATTAGTWHWSTGWSPPTRRCSPRPDGWWSTSSDRRRAAATEWWLALTGAGGEGMVVKPYAGLARRRKGRLVQPGVKCRGREYLRIIYGPDYTDPTSSTGCASATWAASGRWRCASTAWAWPRWTGWPRGRRCGGSTSWSSLFSRGKRAGGSAAVIGGPGLRGGRAAHEPNVTR